MLVVEDEMVVARDLEQQLTKLGYAVVGMTGRGDEAVRLTERLRPDIVLMDIRLKGAMDGITAAEIVRQRFHAAVIFLTAHADASTLERARLAEPFGYLLKPFDERDLRTTIEMGLYKHAAEMKLRASERRFATTLASIGDGVIATDQDGTVTFVNLVAEKLIGRSATETHGKPLADVYRVGTENTLIRNDGTEILIEQSISPIQDEQGDFTGQVIAFRDVTEAKRVERHLCHMQRMESIGQLAGGIAHDFNNVLTAILCGIDLLRQETGSDTAAGGILDDIERAGRSGTDLTRQLLAFSQQKTIQPVALDMNRVIQETIDTLLRRLIGSHIQLVTRLDPLLGPVKADPSQLSQVLVNLAVNARDAMPNGGTLLIETLEVRIDGPTPQTPPDMPPGDYRQLRVTDTGHGMNAATLTRIFEPFFTTKGIGKGTGLGLATVYGIVKQANGWQCVTSEVGHGTTFNIFLPAISERAVPGHVPGLSDLPRGTETILFVDDENVIRNLVRCILSGCGYRVHVAQDGFEALEIVAGQPNIDLLITDFIMPGMTGME